VKLIKFQNRTEGQVYPLDAIIVVGRQMEGKKPNGFYFVVNFFKPHKLILDFIDPSTFRVTPTVCFYRYSFLRRRPCGSNKKISVGVGTWCPVSYIKRGEK